MKIKYITCSDPRNYNSFDELFGIWNLNQRVEIAVQMHPGKVSQGTDRYTWISLLIDKLSSMLYRYNMAIHVNQSWCNDICNGKIPYELAPLIQKNWLYSPYPVVQRIQLNMPRDTAESFNPNKLKGIIESFPNQEFILQYNDKTKNAVKALHETGVKFSLLYDASGGRGIMPDSWSQPVYQTHMMGYAGGLGPDNIRDNLDRIHSVVYDDVVWIDAEGKLKVEDKFNSACAKKYVLNALDWLYKQK